jgi:hypothetical protein
VSKKFIIFFILLAFAIRLFSGPDRFIFSYDQARDAFVSRGIIENRDIKIIGPPAAVDREVTGAFHGPLFYYLISPFYVLSQGNPNAALFLMIFLNTITLIPLALLVQKLFKNKAVTLISLLLFTFSFEQHSYARWLSNPGPAIFFLSLFHLGLWQILDQPKSLWGWCLAPLGLSLAIQHQLFLIFALPTSIFIILVLGKFPQKIKPYLIAISTLTLGLSSFFVAELKFGFQMTKSLFLSLFTDLASSPQSTIEFLKYFLNHLSQTLMNNTLNINQPLAFCLFLLCLAVVFYSRKQLLKKDKKAVSFLLLLIFSQAVLFLFSELKAYFITLGMAMPIIILTSFSLVILFKKQKLVTVLLLVLIIATNLIKIVQVNQQTTPIFAIQENMTLENEKKVIEACYRLVEDHPFSLNTVTNPFFINTTWAYLFQWYGLSQSDYLPSWSGISQKGNLGEEIFPQEENETKLRILIIEPTYGVSKTWVEASLQEENLHSVVIKEEKISFFTVQLRQKLSDQEKEEKLKEINLLRQKALLSPQEKAFLHTYDLRKQAAKSGEH